MSEQASTSHPSGDHRFQLLEAAMKRCQYRQDSLIEILHSAQELFGCLQEDLLFFVARSLKLPPSRVYGVATFYHFFSLQPKGVHTCILCTGTACYVKGAPTLMAVVSQTARLAPGQTTPDGRLSFHTARCLGACGIAPTAVFDGMIVGRQTPESMREFLGRCIDGRN
jgi:bidirectional [NiFe] hydrogenase diaphorase subunit